jgi:hypothetical protein
MNRQAHEALIRRNAEACENARSSRCACSCGGSLHGQVHTQAWIEQQIELAKVLDAIADMAALGKLAAVQGDLFR